MNGSRSAGGPAAYRQRVPRAYDEALDEVAWRIAVVRDGDAPVVDAARAFGLPSLFTSSTEADFAEPHPPDPGIRGHGAVRVHARVLPFR